jgi:hypothetical protein
MKILWSYVVAWHPSDLASKTACCRAFAGERKLGGRESAIDLNAKMGKFRQSCKSNLPLFNNQVNCFSKLPR